MTIWNPSESVSASRRASRVVTPLGPWESNIRAPTYSASSSKRKRTSVRSDAGRPSSGSICVSSVIGAAACHAASSTRPSRTIGPDRRAACASGTGTLCPKLGSAAAVVDCAWTSRASATDTSTASWHGARAMRRPIRAAFLPAATRCRTTVRRLGVWTRHAAATSRDPCEILTARWIGRQPY